jgi:hypothetical protein
MLSSMPGRFAVSCKTRTEALLTALCKSEHRLLGNGVFSATATVASTTCATIIAGQLPRISIFCPLYERAALLAAATPKQTELFTNQLALGVSAIS